MRVVVHDLGGVFWKCGVGGCGVGGVDARKPVCWQQRSLNASLCSLAGSAMTSSMGARQHKTSRVPPSPSQTAQDSQDSQDSQDAQDAQDSLGHEQRVHSVGRQHGAELSGLPPAASAPVHPSVPPPPPSSLPRV